MSASSDLFHLLTPDYQMEKPWWQVAKSYFDSHTFTEHQLESYNIFMQEKLPSIITSSELEYTKDNTNYIITFDNVYTKKPEWTEPSGIVRKLMPQDCRIRNLSYNCRVYTDITRYALDGENKIVETKTFPSVFIGAMPCMFMSKWCNFWGKTDEKILKSGECVQDKGGYFIINGSERVLMSQDRMAHNEIFVFECKGKDTIKIPLPGSDKNRSLPCAWSAEVRSYSPICEPNITTTYVKLSSQQLDKGEDQRLYVETTGLKAPVPWPVIFMALGVTDRAEMISYVCSESDEQMIKLLEPSLECFPITNQEEALKYLSELGQPNVLTEKLFQNVTEIHMKRCYLGHMTFQLLSTVLDRRKQDDRDHYGKKRVETAGNLINNLFKSVWKRVLREVKSHLEKKRSSDLAQVFYSRFSNYIRQPFATGNWTATKGTGKAAKAGISQILNRHNYVSTISNLRRVVTPNDKNSKVIKPRHLHASQWMKMCPSETPEGQTTGLIKNLAMMTSISTGSGDEQIINWLEMRPQLATTVNNMPNFKPSEIQDKTKIFVNGTWVGITEQAEELVENLRALRRQGKIMYQSSISLTKEGLRVYTDEGRVLTPFFIVKQGKLPELPEKFCWSDLVEGGIIEYLDPSEMETLYIADEPWTLNEDHTHAVVHPAFMLGISASTNPFSNHTQAPRVCYQSAMSKQALGVFSNNFLHRYDTSAHVLCYPQVPIVDTKTMGMVGSHELPSGQNLIVAVMSAAYNQEDSVIVNQRAIDNGALRSINYSTYSESCRRKGNTIDEIKRPEKNVKETRMTGYEKLDIDGIAKEGTPLCKRDIVISKVTQTPTIIKDISEVIKTNGMEENSVVESFLDGDPEKKMFSVYNGSAVVDRSVLTINEDSFRTVKVRVRQMRVPQIGDKVASRSAQKGIIGMIVPPENMIFSKATGMNPDLVMNPNAFPSRMTISQTLETILSKACTLRGEYGDCTPFEPEFKWGLEEHKVESLVDGANGRKIIAEELKKWGFDECGDEVMINGMTGEEMPCKIFMGPTFYQRLKHMVNDKIHCLAEGTEVLTTRGWMKIENVTIEDKVAVLKNNMLNYEHPEEIHHYPDYTGPMYYIKNSKLDLAVTGNHRMWVSQPDESGKWSEFHLERADGIVGKPRKYKSFTEEILVNVDLESEEHFVEEERCPVYCLTVSSGVFYVRRNGKECWTGNSRNQDGPRETLTRQPVKVAGVRSKILASPSLRAKPSNSGKPLKLLIPNSYRNI